MKLADRRGIDPRVYGAAEDSWLLAATVSDHVTSEDLVLEVGTGSGYVAAVLTAETGARVVGCDLNPHACKTARNVGVPVVRADLVAPFVAGAFDVVVFNPPYLPIPDDDPDWFELAVAGGPTGREVIERFLDDVARVLRPAGSVFMLVSTLTGVDEVSGYAARHGLGAARVVAEESYPGEVLVVLNLINAYK